MSFKGFIGNVKPSCLKRKKNFTQRTRVEISYRFNRCTLWIYRQELQQKASSNYYHSLTTGVEKLSYTHVHFLDYTRVR